MLVSVKKSLARSCPAFHPDTVREMDAALAQALGAQGDYQLMQAAGAAALTLLQQLWPATQRLHILCGAGNNGGDGYVLGRLALNAGYRVHCYAVGPKAVEGSLAARVRQEATDAGVAIRQALPTRSRAGDLIVEALLGIGASGAPRPEYAQVIEWINAQHAPVLALDVPAGVDAVTGSVASPCVKASATLCFVALKSGLMTGPACSLTGNLWLDDLGARARWGEYPAELEAVPFRTLQQRLPKRSRDAHKGDFGRVLVIGGDYGWGGAAILAAGSALRAGAGSVVCATRDAHIQPGLGCFPEIMFRDVSSRALLLELIEGADVVAIGPGLGQSPWGEMCLDTALASDRPLVIDADGLNLLAGMDRDQFASDRVVLTPHPGEAARLLAGCCEAGEPGDWTAAKVNADRLRAVTRLAETTGATVLLKGAGTLICTPPQRGVAKVPRVHVQTQGNPGMAAAGMGDILTGIIAGLMAQGLEANSAACLGAAWHARAADLRVRQTGELALSAPDLLGALGVAWRGTSVRGRRPRSVSVVDAI